MRRASTALLVLFLALAGCTADEGSEEADAAESTTTTVTSTTIAEPSTTTTQPPATTTTTAPPTTTTSPPTTTTTTLPPVTEVEAGLFCRDLNALGYDYASAVTYWVKEGSPDRMDADRNGIPCETVYPPADVVAFWGDPLPTTTAPPSLTLAGLEAYVGEQWQAAAGYPIDWECRVEHGPSMSAGSAWVCVPSETGEGEFPVLTALVLDNTGTVAVAQSGTWYPDLLPGMVSDRLGPGKFCRDVLNPEIGLSDWVVDPGRRYFGAVLYWFEEGRPDRMDADVNGIPCETLVDSGVVTDFWGGGLVADTW